MTFGIIRNPDYPEGITAEELLRQSWNEHQGCRWCYRDQGHYGMCPYPFLDEAVRQLRIAGELRMRAYDLLGAHRNDMQMWAFWNFLEDTLRKTQ